MGSLYRRQERYCTTCRRRLLRTAERERCTAQGHAIEIRRSKVWWLKYRQNGRAVRESTETTKQTVARRMLRVREGDVEHGIPIDPKAGRITFEDAATDLLNEYQVNKRRSLANVKRRIEKHLTPFFRGRRLAAISTADVRAYITDRQRIGVVAGEGEQQKRVRDVSNGEINRELAVLKRMFRLAIQASKIHTRPYISMLREDNVRTGFFERDQFESVRAHLPAPLQPVVTFAYLTGWRIPSEVLPLEWRHVDLQAGTVRLDPGAAKNREGRVFPLTTDLRDLLVDQQREGDRLKQRGTIIPNVFHRDGVPIKDFRKGWLSACKAAGCPGRIPHDLRRTAVRNLVRAGVPERVAMQMTGHKTRSVFERYNIVSESDLVAAAAKLNAVGTLLGTLGTSRRVQGKSPNL